MEETLECLTLEDLLSELSEQSDELLDFGNSHEKAEGLGMQRVITALNSYYAKNTTRS